MSNNREKIIEYKLEEEDVMEGEPGNSCQCAQARRLVRLLDQLGVEFKTIAVANVGSSYDWVAVEVWKDAIDEKELDSCIRYEKIPYPDSTYWINGEAPDFVADFDEVDDIYDLSVISDDVTTVLYNKQKVWEQYRDTVFTLYEDEN